MKHTKILVVALLVALMACLSITAMASGVDAVNCGHAHLRTITTDPGCLTKGVVEVWCEDCGLRISYTEMAPLGHAWGDWVVSKEPNCGSKGVRTQTCTRCGHQQREDIPVNGLPHKWEEVPNSAVAATCLADGVKASKVCKVCGTKQKGAVDPATGHDFNGVEWVPFGDNSTCQYHGHLRRACANGCGYFEYKELPLVDHNWSSDPILPAKANSCTTNGCKAVYECVWCGAQKGGDVIPATGHNFGGQTWEVDTKPTCQTNGKLYRVCANGCGAKEYMDAPKIGHAWAATPILPEKPATCETTGCKAVYQCTTPGCGATKGGETIPATGHNIGSWGWLNPSTGEVDYSMQYATSCDYTGTRVGVCTNANCNCYKNYVTTKVPAYGHSAIWQMEQAATPVQVGIWKLNCTRCGKTIGTQIVAYGEKAPSGAVNTGAAQSTNTVAANVTSVTSSTVGKNPTSTSTKTATAKTSTKTSTKSSASTKTAAAPATTETKKVATVAAVAAPAAELEANQAQLVADKHLYVVKNVAGEEIVLTVNVADGKITVEAALAEGESLVLYANAEAIENPTAENTLVLTANEAVELPEAFANAIVAVVKTESLPTAVAAK